MKWAFSFIFSSSSFRDDIPFYLVLIVLTNVIRPSEEELNEYRISQQIQPTDRISLLGLAQLAPGKPVECRLAHADGSVDAVLPGVTPSASYVLRRSRSPSELVPS